MSIKQEYIYTINVAAVNIIISHIKVYHDVIGLFKNENDFLKNELITVNNY